MSKDYYKILGVDRKASKDEIKKAFRKKAQQYHPDKQDGDDKKFKEANEAYAVLSNDKKRQQYDTFGSAGPNMGGAGAGGFGGFGNFDFSQFETDDIFSSFFGGSRRARTNRGEDISLSINLTFAESIFGAEKTIAVNKNSTCDSCAGSGAEAGSAMKTCSVCSGQGQTVKVKQTILGAVQTQAVCDDCQGTGQVPEKICSSCAGRGVAEKREQINVHIPAGVETGQKLRVVGKGEAIAGGVPGDLYLFISVATNRNFQKRHYDLYTQTEIPLTTAVLGGTVEVEGVDEKIKIKIKAGTQNGKRIKIKGQGVGEKGKHRGDLYTTIQVNIPSKLSSKEKKLFKELREL